MIEKELYQFCGETRKYIWYSVILNCLKLIAGITFAFIFAHMLNALLQGEQINYLVAFGLLFAVIIIKQICIRFSARKNAQVALEVKHSLRTAIFSKAIKLGPSYQRFSSTQEMVHLGVEGVEQLENYFGGYLTQFYYCFFSSLILFAAVLPFSIAAAIILLVVSPLIPFVLQIILRLVKKVQREYWGKYANVGNLFLDSLQGLTTLKIFKADQKRSDEIDNKTEQFRLQTMKLLAMQLNSMTVIDWIAYGGASAGIIAVVLGFSSGEANLFGAILILLLAAEFFIPMRLLTSQFHVAMTGVAAAEKILSFLKEEVPDSKGDKLFEKRKEIYVRDLSFVYKDGTIALRNVNLLVKPGNMTAITGPSGCGKSTLASIMCGVNPVKKQSLFCGKTDFANLVNGELEKNIGHITHEGHIFSGTIRSNLLMGNPKAAEEDMISVLQKVRLWHFLSEKQGLDTVVLSQGKNLSGGQAQRLSLARAILHDYEIYIFDEATSNIDVESEEIILETIKQIAKEKTVIFITHRLSAIKEADRIYVMKDGSIVESGKHDLLIKQGGMYQSLFREQEVLQFYRKNVLAFNNADEIKTVNHDFYRKEVN